MRPSNLRSRPFLGWASLAPFLAFGALAAPQPAAAQFYFRPFAYFYRAIEEPAPDVSQPRIASILRREGFRLYGPLGRRGDQIVATGVDANGGRRRFIIDPYEGDVVTSRPVGPAVAHEGPHDGLARAEPLEPDDEAIEPQPADPTVIPGIGGEGSGAEIPPPSPPRPAARPRAKAATRAGGNPHRGAGHLTPSQGTKVAPAPASTITPPPPESGAQPPVPAQATTAAPAAPPAAAPEAAPVVAPAAPTEATATAAQPAATPASAAGAAPLTDAPAAVPAPSEHEKSPSADKDSGSQPSAGG